MPKTLFMTDDEEISFDVEGQSLPRPLPITSGSRIDSTGLPIPPPPPPDPPASTPSTKRSVFHAVNHKVAGANKRIYMTPPGAKLSFPTTPNTPATVLAMQDEEIDFSNQEDTEDNSTSGSDTVIYENSADNRKKRRSLASKSAMVSILFMVLLLITILVAAYFFLSEKRNDNAGQNDTENFANWNTIRPSVSAPGTFKPPSNSPIQGPENDLTLTPTRGSQTPGTTEPPSNSPTQGPANDLTLTPTRGSATPIPPSFTWTSRPTEAPTLSTPDPTFQPTVATPDGTPSPTVFGATMSPTNLFHGIITSILFEDNSVEPNNPVVQKAVKWLVDEATVAQSVPFTFDQKYRQRFGILMLYFSVDPNGQATGLPNEEMRNRDECTWTGMRCNENGNQILTEIVLPNRQLDGTLPAEWGSFFPNLKSIDISQNKLQGSIPEGLYDILGLEEVYLYKNQLTGTISSKIGDLWSLDKFQLSHNRLSGSIPPELGSAPDRIRRIRYFNVHRNQMTGSIPSNMRLRQLFLLDLGYNRFSSTLPPDFGTESVRLRHLYLDHNKFEGTFPSEVLNAGGGRLRTLVLNDNKFTGTFPGNHQYNKTILEISIQNNNFVSMDRQTCQLDVWSGGELVEFKSDCLVCRCGVTFMCKHCEL